MFDYDSKSIGKFTLFAALTAGIFYGLSYIIPFFDIIAKISLLAATVSVLVWFYNIFVLHKDASGEQSTRMFLFKLFIFSLAVSGVIYLYSFLFPTVFGISVVNVSISVLTISAFILVAFIFKLFFKDE